MDLELAARHRVVEQRGRAGQTMSFLIVRQIRILHCGNRVSSQRETVNQEAERFRRLTIAAQN
jgi:hypothetical protein